ncbi:oxidoreductase [Dactylosporangium sucinum]|uniref:Oxidoreductase n=2 Tax=Dactylosporangium sucinum TaxID=1424081 RepID=A0A917WQQ3_9ACTN|nr:oxidoreductase [Dactylosporangium sucinum]
MLGSMRRWWIVSGVVLVVVAGIGAVAWWRGWFADPTVRDAPTVAADVEVLASRLEAPWGVAFLPDGSALVTERDSARIRKVTPGGTVTEVQRIAEARPRGEGGLLGIAVRDDWVYVYYTAENDNRVARMRLGEPPQPILTGIPKAGNHNGGRIAFGPDGMLYVGTGDAAQSDRAQDRANLGGKILRVTPEGRPAPGNPFGDSPVWTMGHRNVQGLAWDADGRMYATEFGQNRYDELNRIEPGRNYGWPEVEGKGDDARYVEPVATFTTNDASPSGLAIAGGRAYLACLRGQKVYRLGLDGGDPQVLLAGRYGRIRHVAAAPDGSLWVLTSNRDGRGEPENTDDRILRLHPPS